MTDAGLSSGPMEASSSISDLILFPKQDICRTMTNLDETMGSSFFSPTSTPFKYEPLPSNDMIRLVVLEPSDGTGTLNCTLITTRLADAPEYEALSYVWGSAVKLRVIWCNGKHLRITSNLYTALRSFQSLSQQRILWADAICINQQDIVERNLQVRLMGGIFQRATRVLAWLGPEDERDNDAMELIEQLGSICAEAGYTDPQDLVDHEKFQEPAEPVFPSLTWNSRKWRHWQALSRFFELPYFCRTWIIQEVQACQECVAVCGAMEVDFSYIQFAAIWYLRLPPNFYRGAFTDRGLSNAIYMRTLADHENTTLLTRLEQSRGFFATDPRDKVFAFLRPGDKISVDYNKPAWTVFAEASVQMFQENGFDCLSYVLHNMVPNKAVYEQFPTWAPTFSNSFIMPFCKIDSFAAGGNRGQLQYSFSGSTLKTKAIRIDEVVKVYPKLTWGSFEIYDNGSRARASNAQYALPTHLDWLWKEYTQDDKGSNKYRTGCPTRAAFALTLTAGLRRWASKQDYTSHENSFAAFSKVLFKDAATTFERRKHYGKRLFHSLHTSFLCECFQEDSIYEIRIQGGAEAGSDPDEHLRRQHLENTQYFQRAVQSACNNRCFFVTESGYMGLGPHIISRDCQEVWDEELGLYPEMELGERKEYEIWVLPGARTPFILKKEEDRKQYQLIGECYVHGLMEGQAMLADEYRGKAQEIELR